MANEEMGVVFMGCCMGLLLCGTGDQLVSCLAGLSDETAGFVSEYHSNISWHSSLKDAHTPSFLPTGEVCVAVCRAGAKDKEALKASLGMPSERPPTAGDWPGEEKRSALKSPGCFLDSAMFARDLTHAHKHLG